MRRRLRRRHLAAIADRRRRLVALVAAAALTVSGISAACARQTPGRITGPYASLLASSQDLGPSRTGDAQLTVTLTDPSRTQPLTKWATDAGLWVRARAGDGWAIVEGAAADLARAFDVPVHDYRGLKGQVFYASPQQPSIPSVLRDVVSGIGRINSYTPHRMASPGFLPLDVRWGGLTPEGLLQAYNGTPLADQGFTGEGQTIVFFAFDSADQADLDLFADTSGLPRFTPVIVGGKPEEQSGETAMDLQVAHAIAPLARLVVVNARPTVQGDGAFEKIAKMFEDADRQFPGAVWSLSIGWGCDKLFTAADLAPVVAAVTAAQRRGTSVFDASGDTAGLECKGGENWSAPPGPDDIGLDAVSSIPNVTSVGGTTLSTSPRGQWVGEYAWVDSPLTQGTSGGVSILFDRPPWQSQLRAERDTKRRRLSPDVAAVSDPFTGVRVIYKQTEVLGGGTSQAAPMWAAMTALINEYLNANGGRPVGNANAVLYRVAAGANLPGFRDIVRGGNAVDIAHPGYDLVTGLGTPNVYNLAQNILELQERASPR
ncbi:protease pro-enzyme activation domain-containing protein [Mycobacterium sp. NPDC051804]|uniref:S53 family peptidase n=1 Tax=Mycobacterium sp. NPDC051804 TaxID=3364295 RepID=UPI00379BFAF0